MSAVAGLMSCGFGTVDVAEFEPEPGTSDVCTALYDDLPDVIGNAVQRQVSIDEPLAAAWGHPPIILRCGVPLPSSYRPDSQLFEVDGVGWLADDAEGGRFFTSVDRAVFVEIAVPDEYEPEAEVLADLAEPILDNVPERPLP